MTALPTTFTSIFQSWAPTLKLCAMTRLHWMTLQAMSPKGIVISPGPCTPKEAGISGDVVLHYGEKLPILGVCLGHQTIGFVYGGTVGAAEVIMHGKTSMIHHDGKGIYQGLPNPFEAIRYHSPDCGTRRPPRLFGDNRLDRRGCHHGRSTQSNCRVEGVQFHPESILTKVGHDLLRNYLDSVDRWGQEGNVSSD